MTDDKKLSSKEKLQIECNKRHILHISKILIFWVPIVYLSSDEILKYPLFTYLAWYIAKYSHDHGKRYGRKSFRLGVSRFFKCNIVYKIIVGLSILGVGNDLYVEYITYRVKHNYTLKTKDDIENAVYMYQGFSPIPTLTSDLSVYIVNFIPGNKKSFGGLLKEKLTDHFYSEVSKKERTLVIMDLQKKGIFIEEEKRGLIEYFLIGTFKRVGLSFLSSFIFILRHLGYFAAYSIFFYFLINYYVKKQTTVSDNEIRDDDEDDD